MTRPLSVESSTKSDAEWDEALSRLDGRTFCHQAGWSEVFGRAFGHESIRLVANDPDGSVVGLLPLVRLKSRLWGHHLVSMPFLNYGGPVGSDGARRALATRASEIAQESGAQRMELRSRQGTELGLPTSLEKVTVLLPLPSDPEVLWERGLKAKVRSQIRRPRKAGMTTEFGHDHLSRFYEVFCENMRDLGTPVLPARLFDIIAAVFGDQFLVGVVYKDREAVAAGAGFLYEGEFEITWASSLRSHAREAPNMLLYWSFMEEVIRRGGSTFNFGRCSPGSGTHRFKRQWGGEDTQLHWSTWSSSGDATKPERESSTLQLATKVWQRLPLPIANVLGPWVSSSLPSW